MLLKGVNDAFLLLVLAPEDENDMIVGNAIQSLGHLGDMRAEPYLEQTALKWQYWTDLPPEN